MNRLSALREPAELKEYTSNQAYTNMDTYVAFRFLLEDFLNNNKLLRKFKKIVKSNRKHKDHFTRENLITIGIKEALNEACDSLLEIFIYTDRDKINYNELADRFKKLM